MPPSGTPLIFVEVPQQPVVRRGDRAVRCRGSVSGIVLPACRPRKTAGLGRHGSMPIATES